MNKAGVGAKNQWIPVENEDDVDVNGETPDTLWYYFGDNGKAYKADSTDLKKKTCPDSTGSRTYFFDSEGHMASGWVEDKDGYTYYCGTENEGWAYTGWQYLEPSDDMVSEVYDDQEWFNFKSSGKARTSTTWYSKGKYYNFNSDGVMNSDWYDLTIATVATDADGNSVIGTSNTTISKGAYTTEDGTKGTGWVYAEDQAEDGNSNAVVTLEEDVVYNGHKILKDSTVVVSSTGKLRTSGTVKVDGVKYEISSNTKADAKWDAVEKPE